MMSNPPKKNETRKKRKGKTTTTSTSSSGNTKCPNEAELKLLRARYQNKYNAFAGEIGHSNDPNQRAKVVCVSAARRRASQLPIILSSPIDDGFAPTVFEQVNGGFRPARTKLRHRDIFKMPPWAKQCELLEKATKSEDSEPTTDSMVVEMAAVERKRQKNAAKKQRERERVVKKAAQTDKVVLQADVPKPAPPVAEKAAEKPTAESSRTPSPPSVVVESKSVDEKPKEPEVKLKPPAENLYGDVIAPTTMPPTAIVTSATSVTSSASPTSVESGPKISRFMGKKALFDSMGDEIVLDDKILQEIASDLQKGVQFNPDVVDPSLANRLVEIKKRQESVSDADLKQMTEQPYEIDETANKVVETLTSRNVLAKVLDAEELKMLSDYFSGTKPQDEKVLEVLNTALEKILERAAEFYANERELKSFTENRDRAKMRLLDALLSRRAGFLSNLYSNAFVYANYLRDKMANAYQAAAHTYKVANVVAEQSMAAATDAVVYSKEALERSAAAASEAVAYSKDAIGRSAVVASDAVAALEKSAIAREMAQKSHEFVVTARDRVAKAGEMGQGLINTARSWTSSFSSDGGPSPPTPPTPTASDILLSGERSASSEEAMSAVPNVPNIAVKVEPATMTAVDKSPQKMMAKESGNVSKFVQTAVEASRTLAVVANSVKPATTAVKARSSSDDNVPPSPAPAIGSPAATAKSHTRLAGIHEHWLVTLWKVISALIHLPFLLFQEHVANDTHTDRTDLSNLRSSSILVPRRGNAKKKH